MFLRSVSFVVVRSCLLWCQVVWRLRQAEYECEAAVGTVFRVYRASVGKHCVLNNIASDIEESGSLGDMTFSFDVPLDCKVNGNYNLLTGMVINLAKNAAAYSKGTMCELNMTGQDDKPVPPAFRERPESIL